MSFGDPWPPPVWILARNQIIKPEWPWSLLELLGDFVPRLCLDNLLESLSRRVSLEWPQLHRSWFYGGLFVP